MLDLETWGTCPGCAIRSVGAVQFDPETGKMGDEFYANVLDSSCKKLKLVKEEGTIAWWGRQSEEAQRSLVEGQMPIGEVLDKFTAFFFAARVQFVWSQGSNFDEPIISEAYRRCKKQTPWKFWDTRDTRTAYDMAKFNSKAVKRAGTYHNALADAQHQALCVSQAYAKNRGQML